jgi:hypothetical protein
LALCFRAFRAFSVPIESERRLYFLFDAFSSREPVSTPDQVRGRLSLENTLLTVVGQDLRANLAQSGSILLQTRQNGIVAVIDYGPAIPGCVASASRVRPPTLR